MNQKFSLDTVISIIAKPVLRKYFLLHKVDASIVLFVENLTPFTSLCSERPSQSFQFSSKKCWWHMEGGVRKGCFLNIYEMSCVQHPGTDGHIFYYLIQFSLAHVMNRKGRKTIEILYILFLILCLPHVYFCDWFEQIYTYFCSTQKFINFGNNSIHK